MTQEQYIRSAIRNLLESPVTSVSCGSIVTRVGIEDVVVYLYRVMAHGYHCQVLNFVDGIAFVLVQRISFN